MRIREGEGVEAIHCPESDISRVLELTCPFLPDSSLVSMELSFFFPLILPWDQPLVTLWEIKYQDVGNLRSEFGQNVGDSFFISLLLFSHGCCVANNSPNLRSEIGPEQYDYIDRAEAKQEVHWQYYIPFQYKQQSFVKRDFQKHVLKTFWHFQRCLTRGSAAELHHGDAHHLLEQTW